MAKTLSYINTTPRVASKQESVGTSAQVYRPHSSSSGITMSEVLNRLLPLIGENYADLVTLLTPESYLYNPAFADGGDGWTISDKEKAYITTSDGKNRLFMFSGSVISQANDKIRQPGKHKEYTFTKEEEDGATPPEAEIPDESFDPSEELVTDPVEWGDIEEPEKVSGEEEKPDTLYLSFSYICKEPGTLTIGFPESDQTPEEALKVQTIQLESSGNIQTVTAQGTWDGKGPFQISLSLGQVEIVSLSLLDKPLEEYRKQTDSYIKQTIENIGKSFDFIKQTIRRITLIQSHINQLYSNDVVLKTFLDDHDEAIKDLIKTYLLLYELIEGIQATLADHDTRITKAQEKASSAAVTASEAYYKALINSQEISTLSSNLTTLTERVDDLASSISSLSSRVSALESAGST